MPTNALLLGCGRLDLLFVHDYVQLWIDGPLRIAYPVLEDTVTVVLLSEMAVSRLSLDSLLQDWESLSQDWENEVCARYDSTTARQYNTLAERATIILSISTTHNHLTSACSHPGYASPPFPSWVVTTLPGCFRYPSLCILCLSPRKWHAREVLPLVSCQRIGMGPLNGHGQWSP
jgi:hypothetical protein